MKRLTAFLMAVLIMMTTLALAVPVNGAWYPPELCPHGAADPHNKNYDASKYWYAGGCKNCSTICDHPEEYREYYCETDNYAYGHYIYQDGVHYRLYTCIQCGTAECIEEYGSPCTVEYRIIEDPMCHDVICTVCGYAEKYPCEYKTYTKKTSSDKTHSTYKKCVDCGRIPESSEKNVNHTYKNNKCTKCGFKRVVPGTVKVKSASCTKKGTKKTYKTASGSYYQYTYKIDLSEIHIDLLRHGEDEQDKLGGWSDNHLTTTGIMQITDVSDYLDKDYDLIISSDLVRSRETADIVAAKLSKSIIFDEKFREINNGKLKNLTKEEFNLTYPGLYYNTLSMDQAYPNGESPTDFYIRIKDAFIELLYKYKGKKILIITHGGVITVLQCLINGWKYSNLLKITVPHAALVKLNKQ